MNVLEGNKKLIDFLQGIHEEEQLKIDELESVFHIKYALLPTRLSSGKFIWFRHYCVRYRAESVKYIEHGKHSTTVTKPYKHYIDKDYVLNYNRPIEKLSMPEYVKRFGV